MMSLIKAFGSLAVFVASLQKIYKNWLARKRAKELQDLNQAMQKAGVIAKQTKDTSELESLFAGNKKK